MKISEPKAKVFLISIIQADLKNDSVCVYGFFSPPFPYVCVIVNQ